jgi:glycosyltransferase involved in cell wall biosynthesis
LTGGAVVDGRAGHGVEPEPRVSVVVPALNEAKNLPHVLPGIPEEYEVVVVVDGHSADATIEVAIALRPSVRVIQQPGFGKGDALAAGFEAAHGDIIVMLDADGSADAAEIPRFVEHFKRMQISRRAAF